MAVELHHVFPGEAAGGAHQQQQGLIHPLARGGIHHVAVEHPVAVPHLLARCMEELAADRFCPGPGEAHDRHPALPRGNGGGDGGDGVGGGGQQPELLVGMAFSVAGGQNWMQQQSNGRGSRQA